MDLWDLLPSPAAASGAPTLYLLGNWPFSVALALRVRPRAGRAPCDWRPQQLLILCPQHHWAPVAHMFPGPAQ